MESTIGKSELPPGYHAPELDADSDRFWQWAGQHQVLLQQCAECGTFRWPPRSVCWSCGCRQVTEVPASGRASVYSWTVVHHPTGSVADRLPYTIVLAALEEDPRILLPGQLDGDREDLRRGAALQCTFHDLPDGVTVLHWTVVDAATDRCLSRRAALTGGGPHDKTTVIQIQFPSQ